MTEDLDPGTADGPQSDQDAWRRQYEPKPPLLTSPASAASTEPPKARPLWLAFLAAAAVALVGGLLWAGITIATGYNLGFLALVIGAVTGLTAQRVAGAGIGGFERGLSGLFAAGAIIVGDYVIFVHELRVFLAPHRIQVGYLATHQMSYFVNHIGTIVHGFDWFWIVLAAYAAFRTAGGIAVMGIGRRRF